MVPSRGTNICIKKFVCVVHNSQQNYAVPPLVVIIIGRVFLWGANFNVAPVECAYTLGKASACSQLLHVFNQFTGPLRFQLAYHYTAELPKNEINRTAANAKNMSNRKFFGSCCEPVQTDRDVLFQWYCLALVRVSSPHAPAHTHDA